MIKFYRHRAENGKYIYGLRIWKRRNTTIELWFMGKGRSLPIHRHPLQNVELMPLLVDKTCMFCRRPMGLNICIPSPYEEALNYVNKYSLLTQKVKGKCFKWYSTPDTYYHWFANRTGAILFISKTTWLCDQSLITSPSKNYINLKDDLNYE